MFRSALVTKEAAQRDAVRSFFATQLQRVYRGFYSRKYNHDFYARKEYVQAVMARGDTVRNATEEELRRQELEADARQQKEDQVEFRQLTQNLHHLVSTKATPGVYNSPYLLDEPITAYQRPVEEHIRAGARELLRSQTLRERRRHPPRHSSKLSLRATGTYGVDVARRKEEEYYAKKAFVGDAPFVAGNRVPTPPHKHGTGVNTAYVDAWRIQMSTRELNDRDTSKRISRQPYYTAVGANRDFDRSLPESDLRQPHRPLPAPRTASTGGIGLRGITRSSAVTGATAARVPTASGASEAR